MAASKNDAWTVGKLINWTTQYFSDRKIENPRLDVEVLLAQVLDCQRIDLYANFDENVIEADRDRFRELIRKRAAGCPVAYLVGYREFYTLKFDVTPAVLIPRPETEHVIMESLPFLKQQESGGQFCDLGTGSGAIAVTLAHEAPNSKGLAIDISAEALSIAKQNAAKHKVEDRLSFLQSDLFSEMAADQTFDLVVSNPPYVTLAEWESLDASTRDYEPRQALVGGEDGLTYYRQLAEQTPQFLRPHGMLVLEIGMSQERAVHSLLQQQGVYRDVVTVRDLAGHPRVIRSVYEPR